MEQSLIFASIAALLVGISKGGIKGLGVLMVALMAYAYGAKNSVGILLPLLCVGDILAIVYFKKHVKWKYLLQFMPMMVVGVLVAVWLGKDWNELVFKKWMSWIIIISVIYMFWSEYKNVKISTKSWFLSGIIGFAAGVTTMIGNLAGPFANLYFLATKLPKKEIVGTSAWVFFLINLFKFPFHVFVWKTIDNKSLFTDLYLIPSVILGFYIGTKLLDLFSENNYRRFLLIITALGAILILFR